MLIEHVFRVYNYFIRHVIKLFIYFRQKYTASEICNFFKENKQGKWLGENETAHCLDLIYIFKRRYEYHVSILRS